MSRVYVLIVNWNGWKDTIECLESVFRNVHPNYRVIVCDNGSADGSVEAVKAWAAGDLDTWVPKDHALRRLAHPPVSKPIPVVEHDRSRAEAGGDPADDDFRLVLVRTGANLGFAGGNNVGLRYALARNDFDYVWLLNNDTVIEADALTRLVGRMAGDPGAGICGSTLPLYRDPATAWMLCGGRYHPWLAFARGVGSGRAVDRSPAPAWVERRVNYVAGASMLVSRPFLRDVGLMCEDYFLYFEEPDWAMRAHGRYSLAYAPGSVVYHKVGVSIDAIGKTGKNERATVHYNARNAILFTRKFFPWALPTVRLSLFCQGIAVKLKDRWIRSRRETA